MDIARDQKALATIIIPEQATLREAFAAEELQKYVTNISGAVLPIAPDTSDTPGNAILLGGPDRNRVSARHIDSGTFHGLVPGPEGLLIRSFGDSTLLLAGSHGDFNDPERGILYAVYEFLERFLGCSFVAYGKPGSGIGEYVPGKAHLTVGEVNYIRSSADLPYRTAIVQFDGCNHNNSCADHALTPSFIDWMAKNRLNRIMLTMRSYEAFKQNGNLQEILKRGLSLTVGHHDSGAFFLPPMGNELFAEKYCQTHPEYFRLQADGSRYCPETKWQGQLIYDMRNTQCIKAIAGNMLKWIACNPGVDTVTLWPNDGVAPQCACSECSCWSKMTNYAWFVSEIAKIINREYPQIKIDMLVYSDLWEPPQNGSLGEGVVVDVATWGPNYILRSFGKKDGTGLLGTYFEKNAMDWSAAGGCIVYYDYYMTNFDSKQVYCPMADEILAIHESSLKNGYCRGTGTQIEVYNLWNYLFNFYVHGRKAYNTTLTMDDLLNTFSRVFGQGGQFIADYIRYVEDFYEGQAARGTESANWFISHVDREKVYDLFEKAYDAEPESPLRNNIRLLRMAFRYSDLQTHSPGCDELSFMSSKFGSYWGNEGQQGYGLSVFDKPGSASFIPDKWYAL